MIVYKVEKNRVHEKSSFKMNTIIEYMTRCVKIHHVQIKY